MSCQIRKTAARGAEEVGTAPAGALGRVALALSLPEIDRHVALELPTCADPAWWAKLALLWIDDIPADMLVGTPPNRIVEAAVARWIDRVTGGRRITMDFDVCIAPLASLAIGWADGDGEPDGHWFFSYSHTHSEFWSMHRLDDLETVVPGLGETAWWLLGVAAGRTVHGVTPETAAYRAEYSWWYGTSKQEDLVDELKAMDFSENDIRDYPSVEWWERSFPEHVRHPQRRLNGKRLAELAESGDTEFVRECAALLAEMSRLIDRHAVLPRLDTDLVEGEAANIGIILTHGREDVPMRRFTDDWYNMVNQSGGEGWHDAYGLEAVGFDRMAFRRWKVRTERGLQLFAALDRFVELAGVKSGE